MPSCCLTLHTCLSERSRAMRLTPPMGWDNKCLNCLEGVARQMDKWTPEPTIEPYRLRPNGTHKPGTKPKDACFRGHPRATYGRLQTTGRDTGGWVCRECERLKHARYRTKDRSALGGINERNVRMPCGAATTPEGFQLKEGR
jgi:hypothetical protein